MEVIINYEKNSSCFIDVPDRFIFFQSHSMISFMEFLTT